jgi:hypothetical protein
MDALILPRKDAEEAEALLLLDRRFPRWSRMTIHSMSIHTLLAWLDQPSVAFNRHLLLHSAFEQCSASSE